MLTPSTYRSGRQPGDVGKSVPSLEHKAQSNSAACTRSRTPPHDASELVLESVDLICRSSDGVHGPMLLWTLSRPFEGFFGNKDSGQTNDGPLVLEGKLLSGHASS
jgi:hypothetical protein